MSNVSKGLLFYGYVEPEEKVEDEDGDEVGAWRPAFDLYWGDDSNEIQTKISTLGVELDQTGHYDYATNTLRLTEPYYEVEWNEVMLIDKLDLVAVGTPEQKAALQEAAKLLGIDLTGLEAAWHLGAFYG